MKYTLKITARDGRDEITTLLTNTETGEEIEERWYRVGGEWYIETSWGESGRKIRGLYDALHCDDARTDEILTELEASFTEEMEIEA